MDGLYPFTIRVEAATISRDGAWLGFLAGRERQKSASALADRVRAEWIPVGRPEPSVKIRKRALGRKTGVHFC
jgi:hypothetical protein